MGFYNKYLPNLTEEAEEEAYKEGILSEEYLKSKNPDYLVHNIKELENILLK